MAEASASAERPSPEAPGHANAGPAEIDRVPLIAGRALDADRHVMHMVEITGDWEPDGQTFRVASLMRISAACSW